jgi:chromosome segregation ATPase
MTETATRLAQMQANMEAAAGRFSRLDKAVAELTQRTERLECGVLDLSESLTSAVEQATGRVEEVAGRMEAVEANLDDRLGGLDRRLGTVHARIENVDACLGDLDARLTGLDGRLAALDSRVGTQDDRFEALEGRIDGRLAALDERMLAIESRLLGVDNRLAENGAHLERVTERLDLVDDHVEAVNQRVGQLPATLDLGELRTRVAQAVTALQAEQADRFAAVERRIAEASANLPPILEAINARPDRDEFAAAVSRRLGALEETMLALAEALLRPTRAKD